MAPSLKLQLAIQGGGAKICSLLAAAQAVQEFHEKNLIQVTRIAGSSAGSIVACLLASGQDLPGIRNELGLLGPQLASLFPRYGKQRMFWRAYRGKPFYNQNDLRDFLIRFFNKRGFVTLGDLRRKTGIEVLITTTDIVQSSAWTFQEENNEIVTSILYSCSLPFAFSTYVTGDPYVDGGICENLPTKDLLAKADRDGQVIGISFNRSTGKKPVSAIEFSLALINTAIENSISRSKSDLGEKRVFPIKTDIGLLDFKSALSAGLGEHYDRVHLEAVDFFQNLLLVRQDGNDRDLLVGDPWRDGDPELLVRLYRIYQAQHEASKVLIERASLAVEANCLLPETDSRRRTADVVEERIVLRAHTDPIHCYRLGLGSTKEAVFPGRLSCRVMDGAGRPYGSQFVPVLDPAEFEKNRGGGALRRELVLFFDPVVAAGEDPKAPYTIIMKDLVLGSMSPLDPRKEKKDTISITISPRAEKPVPQVDLVLFIPEDFPRLDLTPESNNSPEGQVMTEQELATYDPSPGFRAVGWTGKDVPPGRFGVNFAVAK